MILYLDTSALLKLYTEEPASVEVRDAADRASTVAPRPLSLVEAQSAAARKLREGALPAANCGYPKACLEECWERCLVVGVSEGLCQEAASLVERYPLRTRVALKPASALAVRQQVLAGIMFSSFDERLNQAATGEAVKMP